MTEVMRTVPVAQLREVVREYMEAKTKGMQEEVEIVIRSLPERVTWTGDSLEYAGGTTPRCELGGPVTVVVNLVVDGQVQNRLVMSVVVRTFAQVLVAARRLPRHSVLVPEDVRHLRMETTFLERPLMMPQIPSQRSAHEGLWRQEAFSMKICLSRSHWSLRATMCPCRSRRSVRLSTAL